MNIIRFSDLCAQGKAQGQRVFIRADLNVPLNDAGEITEDTRVRASVPAIEMALKAGAAVMVTSVLQFPLPAGTRYDAAERRIHQPGSFVPLALMMGIFFTKYGVGVSLAMHPALVGVHPPAAPLREAETALIRQAVQDARGNVAEAARALGISRATVYRKLGHPKGL